MPVRSNRVFLDGEEREIGGRTDLANAGFGFDPDDKDARDFERAVIVPYRCDLRATHKGDIHDGTGAGIAFFGVDDLDGGTRVAAEHDGEALRLCLRITDEALADIVIPSLSRRAQQSHQRCKQPCEAGCEAHESLLSGFVAFLWLSGGPVRRFICCRRPRARHGAGQPHLTAAPLKSGQMRLTASACEGCHGAANGGNPGSSPRRQARSRLRVDRVFQLVEKTTSCRIAAIIAGSARNPPQAAARDRAVLASSCWPPRRAAAGNSRGYAAAHVRPRG